MTVLFRILKSASHKLKMRQQKIYNSKYKQLFFCCFNYTGCKQKRFQLFERKHIQKYFTGCVGPREVQRISIAVVSGNLFDVNVIFCYTLLILMK